MALTYLNLQDHVLALIDRDDSDTRTKVKAYLNMAGRDVWTAYAWRERRGEGTITTVAPYSTGTVASSETTITGTGTTFPSYTAALATFARSYSAPPYLVATRDSGTQLTLADSYAETALSGSSYVVYQDLYSLASDADTLIGVRLLKEGMDGTLGQLTEGRLEDMVTIPGESGTPSVYSMVTNTSGGLKRVRLWPVPDAVYRLKYRYLKAYTDMSADADECVVPESRRDLLICGTLRWAYRLAGQYQKAMAEEQKFWAEVRRHWGMERDHSPVKYRISKFTGPAYWRDPFDISTIGVPV